MTRVAVVGVGAMGRNHVRVYQEMPNVELVAIVDPNRAAAEPLSRMYGVPWYADYCEMLDRQRPEAVSVVVPTFAHYAVGKELLEAGCHILVEKPIAATLEEAEGLINAAERNGRVLMVGHIERFNPAIVELKRRLERGELGQVYQIHARRLGPYPSRIRDVGVVMDLATHDLDIMRYLLGHEAIRACAETRREVHDSYEDLFVGVVRFDDKTVGLLEINWLTPTKIRKLYVTGEYGMFRVNYITQDLCFYENARTREHDWSPLSLHRGVSEGAKVRFAINKTEPLRAELEAFIARVNGLETTVVDGRDAKITLSLAMALVRSAENEGLRETIENDTRQATAREPLSNHPDQGNGANSTLTQSPGQPVPAIQAAL